MQTFYEKSLTTDEEWNLTHQSASFVSPKMADSHMQPLSPYSYHMNTHVCPMVLALFLLICVLENKNKILVFLSVVNEKN